MSTCSWHSAVSASDTSIIMGRQPNEYKLQRRRGYKEEKEENWFALVANHDIRQIIEREDNFFRNRAKTGENSLI